MNKGFGFQFSSHMSNETSILDFDGKTTTKGMQVTKHRRCLPKHKESMLEMEPPSRGYIQAFNLRKGNLSHKTFDVICQMSHMIPTH